MPKSVKTTTKYDVITVGSSTIDVFADTESELIKIMTSHSEEDLIAYPVGSKILIKGLKFLTGGGGTNTAVALSRLGLKTAYLGRIGNDENGQLIKNRLRDDKVEFIGTTGKEPSGFSIVLDSIEDDRTILTHKGANDNFTFKDVNKKKLSAKWFYFSAMTGKAFDTLGEISRYAQKNNIKIAFNPSCYLAEKGKQYLKPVLSRTHLLILNKEEAEIIVGKEDIDHLLKDLRKLGPKIVVITDGKKGALAYDGETHYSINALKVKVKETTGAGDAFAASFLAGLMKKNDISFALKLGVVNSASVVMYCGAKDILLTYQKAVSKIKSTKFVLKHHRLKS